MKRKVKIIEIINKKSADKDKDKKQTERVGKEGSIYTDRIHPGFPFMLEYDDLQCLLGSTIGDVKRVPNHIIITTKHTIYVLKYLDNYKSFYERYISNKATIEDIYDFIDEWHNSDVCVQEYKLLGLSDAILNELIVENKEDRELHEYLGLTEKQYDKFVTQNIIEN